MFRAALPVLAVTLLAACGSSGESASTQEAPPPTTSPATSPDTTGPAATAADPAAVPAALQFSAPLVGGGEIEMGALAGRPVLLWFWAPW